MDFKATNKRHWTELIWLKIRNTAIFLLMQSLAVWFCNLLNKITDRELQRFLLFKVISLFI